MLKFSANIGLLFTELPFEERFAAARNAGFTAVEFPCPEGIKPSEIARLLRDARLEQSLANMPYHPSDLGIAAAPGREREFLERLEIAFSYIDASGCRTLHVLAGKRPAGTAQEDCDETLVRNLEVAALLASRRNLTVVLEAINRRDVPDFSLSSVHHAAQIVRNVAKPNVRLLLDLYHAGTVGEDMNTVLSTYSADAGYVQLAGFANRNEPDDGAADYAELLARLSEAGYSGYVGCEYRPTSGTTEGFAWLARHVGGIRKSVCEAG
ncbi:TIM barrel protein [Burkholderia multivorans]|uniref:TIM barrel protein n=2 Tax=Burkholderia multivorans TaxID=87883 RepID=A0AAP2MT01_9BURK|nr:TIM barrel protein [Burkholderia multivorans]MBU9360738.1 TIM barrel protein [Burkholderia multivorans]MBU9366690.1 TIM barrel protein [Burkholderia multivorans]MBU9598417.1 TIM barrel protein [Burkholderia multivorans]MCA8485859.1 TIM barrel protein [Burkholderia multivorans]